MDDARPDEFALTLSPGIARLIEDVGVYYEHYGLPRIGGRVLGLLLVAKRPLLADEIATLLRVSRASVSTNVRLAVTYGLAELITQPGDRRDYYRYPANAWERGIHVNIEATLALQRIAEQGLDAISAENAAARERLDELADFCAFTAQEMRGMLDRWRAHRAARGTQYPG